GQLTLPGLFVRHELSARRSGGALRRDRVTDIRLFVDPNHHLTIRHLADEKALNRDTATDRDRPEHLLSPKKQVSPVTG
ncbi:hypothetical protein, partial [Cereibacter sphaeroides]|uniref:hypothetical protein n=1 Tax=Cereibacter sphaeroides TaxID=1063 RepID=UPI001B35733A